MAVTGTIGWTIGRGWVSPAALGGDIALDGALTGDGTAWDEYVGTSLIAEDNLTAAVLSANGPVSVFHNFEFGTSFATFSSAIEGGIKWLAGASGTGGAGAGNGVGDPSGVGNGGSNGDDGVKRRPFRPVMERKITMTELVEGGGWRSLLQTGVTRASFTFDGSLSEKRISKKAPERIFGSLGGVVAIVCNMILIRKGEIPSGRGIQYEMMLTKASGEDGRGAILTELVVTGGKKKLSVEFIGIRTAEVTLGDVVERYSLDGLGRPVLKRPERSYLERPPEGKDAGPTRADADQAIVDLWTLDFRRKDFAQTMKKALVLLKKSSTVVFDQYLIDLLKACDAYITAQAVDEFNGEASGAVEKALSALQAQYGVWNGAADWHGRVAVAVASLAIAQAAGVGAGRGVGEPNGAWNEADVKALVGAHGNVARKRHEECHVG